MIPSRPYLIRAIHEWVIDNQMTPHMLVDVSQESVQVPQEYVDDGKIILNVSPSAVEQLVMNNEHISFQARFRGVPMEIFVPVSAVLAVYAKENGRGMAFGEEEGEPLPPDSKPPKPGRPSLKVIK